MKTFLIILAVLQYFSRSMCDRKIVSLAIAEVVRNFYDPRSERFELIFYGSGVSKEIASDILKLLSDEVSPTTVIEIEKNSKPVLISQSAVVLFDTFQAYVDFQKRCRDVNNYPIAFHFLIYIHDLDVVELVNVGSEVLFQFKSFLVFEQDSLRLITYVTFQLNSCNEWTRTDVNQFSSKTRQWSSSEFFPEKFLNFNGCEFVLKIFYPNRPIIDFAVDETGNLLASGYGHSFFQEIGKSANMSVVYNPFNKVFRKLLNKTMRIDATVIIAPMRLNRGFIQNAYFTQSFTSSQDVFLISRTEQYTPFEKLFLPFDYDTWMWLIVTAITAIVTILVVKLTPRAMQHFVFGSQVQSPMLNLLIASFGGSQMVLPGRNFARYILMCFMLFSLIMRAAYQGKQFEFMQKEMRPPDVQTIDEMIDNNFSFFMTSEMGNSSKAMDFMKKLAAKSLIRDIDVVKLHKPQFVSDLLYDGSKRGVLMHNDLVDFLMSSPNTEYKFAKLNQVLVSDQLSFAFPRFNYFYEPFNKQLVRLIEAGIASLYVRQNAFPYNPAPETDRIVLTLDHLGIGFKIWLYFLVPAFVLLVLEHATIFVQKALSNMFWRAFTKKLLGYRATMKVSNYYD